MQTWSFWTSWFRWGMSGPHTSSTFLLVRLSLWRGVHIVTSLTMVSTTLPSSFCRSKSNEGHVSSLPPELVTVTSVCFCSEIVSYTTVLSFIRLINWEWVLNFIKYFQASIAMVKWIFSLTYYRNGLSFECPNVNPYLIFTWLLDNSAFGSPGCTFEIEP